MTCEKPYKETFRFQWSEGNNCDVWSAKNDAMMIDIFVKDGRIFQIDINGFENMFAPFCETEGQDFCKCFFPEEDDHAEMDCPWGSVIEESTSSCIYDVDIDISGEIPLDVVTKAISDQVHPEFAAPASIIDAFSFTWILLDEVNGCRTILKGGQVERPTKFGDERDEE